MRPFTYVRAETPETAIEAWRAAGEDARFLAGGTTLYDLMKLEVEHPAAVIDVRALPGLTGIEWDPATGLRIGAMATMTEVASHPAVRESFPALRESLELAASRQLRNMASVGGNLLQRTRCSYFRGDAGYPCNKREPGSGCAAVGGLDRGHAILGGSESCIATYPGDWAVALAAFDARIEVLGPGGSRSLSIHDLHREPGTTPEIEHTLAPGELVTAITVPALSFGAASTYHKVRDRESYAFALASAAVAVDVDPATGTVREARVAIGGVATRPWRARAAEDALVGRPLDAASARLAGEAALAGATPGTHNAFKVELTIRTIADALLIAAGRGTR
jgi:xanthine dehydrogenase YagS FAD-binding subunit